MSGCDWPLDWPPFDHPDWRPLLDAIEFLCRRFRSVLMTEAKLCTWLNSADGLRPPDLPSLLVNWDGEREPLTGEIRLALRFSKDNPGEFSGSADDIDIARGELEKLELPSILILWPRLERLYELTVAQPEPAAQPEPVEPRTPITPREAAAPREEPPPAAPPPAAACEEQSPPAHEEAKAPKPAKSTPKRAATPKQKSAKRQTGRVTLKQPLTRAALNRLRGRDPGGFSEAQIATLVRQIESLWSEICKDAGIKPEDCSPPGRDMVAGEVDRLRRRR